MRAWAIVALLLAVAFAGCIARPQPLAPAATPVPPLPKLPAGAAPFTMLRCAGDVLQQLAGKHDKDCNVQVTTKNGPAAETMVVADPLDPLHLVAGAKDFTLQKPGCWVHNVWTGVYVTRDGGRTWSNGLIPGYPGDDANASLPLHHYPCASDPALAFGPKGTLYYVSLPYTPCPADQQPITPLLEPVSSCSIDSGLVLSRSRDGGATWDLQVEIAHRYGNNVLDKQWIATDPATGQLYMSYIDTSSGAIEVQRSDDEGASWTRPVPVVQPGSLPDNPQADQFAQIAVGPGSVVHVTYFTLGGGALPEGVWHRGSRDHGQTWDAPSLIAQANLPLDLGVEHKYRMAGMPALAVDAQSGDVYVTWPSRNPVDSDIFAAVSHDEGRSWSQPIVVNDDFHGVPGVLSVPTTPANEQWMSAIAVGSDHVVHITWLDSRDDPTGQSAYVYYAHSSTLGANFSRNVRLSDVPFDGTGGYHQSGSGTIGDYMGLAVTRDGVHAIWADTRNARNDLFTAFIPG